MPEIETSISGNFPRPVEKHRSGSLTSSTIVQFQVAGGDTINNAADDFNGDISGLQQSSKSAQQSNNQQQQQKSIFSSNTKKIYNGVFVTVSMTVAWVGANQFIKYLNFRPKNGNIAANSTDFSYTQYLDDYKAPFFTAWFCTNWLILIFPLFLLNKLFNDFQLPNRVFKNTLNSLNERGYNFGFFLLHCGLFCFIWISSIYTYVISLNVLLATDAIALYATNMCSLYLLSWVILHEQFVGIRIVAVIICDTGIAFLVYMDGITNSPTLLAVLFAVLSAAALATYKVLFRTILGDVNNDQLALILTTIGIINATFFWPVILFLYFFNFEVIDLPSIPWLTLTEAGVLFLSIFHVFIRFAKTNLIFENKKKLVTHLFANFGTVLTYDLFINLALITSVPISGAFDIVLYKSQFTGMNFWGIFLIAIGYFLVLFPANWPDYIIRLIRNIILLTHNARSKRNRNVINSGRDNVDYRTGYIKSHLRSPSGRVR